MEVPRGLPGDQDVYYLLMNVYDSADYYDQVGLAARDGSWHPLWANLRGCGAGTISTRDYAIAPADLQPGGTYHFEMLIQAGKIRFEVTLNGTVAWNFSRVTTAAWFDAQSPDSCGNTTAVQRSFTVFEEIWRLGSAGPPPWPFDFVNITANGSRVVGWDTWTAGVLPEIAGEPDAASVAKPDGAVQIWNEWFRLKTRALRIDAVPGSARAPSFATIEFAPLGMRPSDCAADLCNVSVLAADLGDGWEVRGEATAGSLTHEFDLVINVSSCTPLRTRAIDLVASDRRGLSTKAGLTIAVSDTRAPTVQPLANRTVTWGERAAFQANATDDSGDFNETGSYSWSFDYHGQATVSEGRMVFVTFSEAGNATGTLTVRDCFGNTAAPQVFRVEVVQPPSTVGPSIELLGTAITAALVIGGVAAYFWKSRGRGDRR